MAALIRRASCSALVPLATRSHGSSSVHLRNHLFASWILPFSTTSANTSSPEISAQPPPLADFAKGKQPVVIKSEKLAMLHGLGFDTIKEDIYGNMILRRESKDEIIEIKAKPIGCDDDLCDERLRFDYDDSDDNDDVDVFVGDVEEVSDEEEITDAPHLLLRVKILNGHNFNRCTEYLCRALPDDHDKIAIDQVSIRNAKRSGVPVGRKHLDEFEDFYKERGVEPSNLNFLFNYLEKLNEKENYGDPIRKKVRTRERCLIE